MELNSTSTRKLDKQTIEGQQEAAQAAQTEAVQQQPKEPQAGLDGVKLIINCSLILSPIKGKEISRLAAGDRIRINIVDSNPKAVTVAEAFGAYREGKFSPISGRVKSIEMVPDSGYIIYVVIAKGVLGKIVEEEDNIKVAMDPSYYVESAGEEEAKSNLPVIMVVLTAIAIAIIVILALLKVL
jgi:hypothetical protein